MAGVGVAIESRGERVRRGSGGRILRVRLRDAIEVAAQCRRSRPAWWRVRAARPPPRTPGRGPRRHRSGAAPLATTSVLSPDACPRRPRPLALTPRTGAGPHVASVPCDEPAVTCSGRRMRRIMTRRSGLCVVRRVDSTLGVPSQQLHTPCGCEDVRRLHVAVDMSCMRVGDGRARAEPRTRCRIAAGGFRRVAIRWAFRTYHHR